MHRNISKSSFIAGLTCHRKLWQLLWNRESAAPPSGMDQLKMQFGVRFGEVAHCLYPDAVVIEVDRTKLDRAEEDTQKAIEAGSTVICEATFRHEQCRVLSDVVEKQSDGSWHLIEVKSSTEVQDEHIPDLAFQKWVMEQCGCPVSKCSVVFADKTGIWPDRQSIFQYEDVTDRVDEAVKLVPEQVAPMLKIANSKDARPAFRECISKECHECEFKKTVCWTEISEPTIYDVIDKRKIPALEAENIFYVREIPKDFALYKGDRGHVDCMQSKSVNIDKAAIRGKLEKLRCPIYFLDFESVQVAVPLFDGNHSWEKLPFQYSLHVLAEDGGLRHVEYLHEEDSDPSLPVAEQLLKDIGATGSIVVYHKTMESGVLTRLAKIFPQHAEAFNSMNERIWDLEKIFLKDYRHWRFGSRSSIKVVLPTLIPDLSYETEEISDGGYASLAWIQFLESDDKDERQEIADALRSYCKLDTLAMVELLKHVRTAAQ
jgi:hypothetical protein